MTQRYAKVLDGTILEYRDEPPLGDQMQLPEGKPRWLPVEIVRPDFDPVSEIETGPTVVVLEASVQEVYASRPKDTGEIAAMIADKDRQIEAEFAARCDAPIPFAGHVWHADAAARENIIGIVVMIAAGVPVPDPRPFTPVGEDDPVQLSHADFVGLGAAIAARKDSLFVVKKARQAELAAMTDPAEIDAVDAGEGWE
jgi:hypothetical protein